MPVRVQEEALEIEADLAEPGAIQGRPDCPYPPLVRAGKAPSSVRLVSIWNDHVRASFATSLGGRLFSVANVRGSALWEQPSALRLEEGGQRGLRLPFGVQVEIGSSELTSTGPVPHLVHETGSLQHGGVVFGGLTDDLDWHAAWSLEENSTSLLLELRVHSRSLLPTEAGVSVLAAEATKLSQVGDKAVGIQMGGGVLVLESVDEAPVFKVEEKRLHLGGGFVAFGPRQSRTWKLRVTALPGWSLPLTFADGLAVRVKGSAIKLSSATALDGKVLVSASGKTLESAVNTAPGEIFEADLQERVDRLVLKQDGQVVLDTGHQCKPFRPFRPSRVFEAFVDGKAESAEPKSEEGAYFLALGDDSLDFPVPWALESAVFTAKAIRSLRKGEHDPAVTLLDQALLTNSEDHLLWWAKAVAERHTGAIDGDSSSLLNARFLAPLDPVLRAEAFLRTPISEKPGPSPLVKPLADDPAGLRNVLCLLLDWGLAIDANRLADEALLHRDSAMVRYLKAWALLSFSRMAAEAAEQVRLAGEAGLEPPFPHGAVERRALTELADRFPDDTGLARALALSVGG